MGAYEIESMFKAFDDFDDSVYRPIFLLYLDIAMKIMNIITILMHLLRKSPMSKKRLYFAGIYGRRN